MSLFIHVPYDSIESLIQQFKQKYIPAPTTDATANFVLIDPKNYYGTYGGLLYKSVLDTCANEPYFASHLHADVHLVWWNTFRPKYLGDQHALSVNGRVAVTPYIFRKLIINPLRRPNAGKSSYYGAKARSINWRSAENSDSG